MIRNAAGKHADSIHEDTVFARDGELGPTTDVLFDDLTWTVRYLALLLEDGLEGRQTLITPQAVASLDRQARALHLNQNANSVWQAPHLEANLPVAAQQEIDYYEYLGADPYWGGDPVQPVPAPEVASGKVALPAAGDPHLRSVQEITGYSIETADGSTGHVENLLLDDEAWRIRYLVADTRDWLPAKKVLIPLSSIAEIEWGPEKVLVDLASNDLKEAPAWDPDAPFDRDYETRVHEHYGRTPYWVHE